MTSPEERIAVLETKHTTVEQDIVELKADVRIIRDTLLEARGGWKLFMMVGGFSAAAGAMVGKFLPYIWKA